MIILQRCDGELQKASSFLLVAGMKAGCHGHRLWLGRSRLVIRESFSRKAAPHLRSPRDAGWWISPSLGVFKTPLDKSMVGLIWCLKWTFSRLQVGQKSSRNPLQSALLWSMNGGHKQSLAAGNWDYFVLLGKKTKQILSPLKPFSNSLLDNFGFYHSQDHFLYLLISPTIDIWKHIQLTRRGFCGWRLGHESRRWACQQPHVWTPFSHGKSHAHSNSWDALGV